MNDLVEITLNTILIVDDDVLMQGRLRRLLSTVTATVPQFFCAGDIAGGKALLTTRLANQLPDLALIDIGLPDGSGIELIGWLHALHPELPCVVVSAWGDEETVLAALRAGAIGYLLKEREDGELRMALQSIQRGGSPIDPFVARRILALLPGVSSTQSTELHSQATEILSVRESEILNLVARGCSNREIAEVTALSRFTIEGYTKSIYRKLAVSSRTAAIFEAKARGLLP